MHWFGFEYICDIYLLQQKSHCYRFLYKYLMVTSHKLNLNNNSTNDIKAFHSFQKREEKKKANTYIEHFNILRAVRQQPETMPHADRLSHVWSHSPTSEVILHKHLPSSRSCEEQTSQRLPSNNSFPMQQIL